MIRMRELTDSARAISTICCWPRRSSSTGVSGSMSSSSSAISARVWRSSSAKSTPVAPRISRPMKMLSRTLRFGARLSSWWMIEMPRSRASVEEEKATGLPSRMISPEVGLHDAGEDLHQRRLAGAVLAEQRRHLAAVDVEVHALERVDRAVGLGDVARGEHDLARRRGWRPACRSLDRRSPPA